MSRYLRDGVREVLSADGLKRPDGRALCLYRVPDEAFERLADALREVGREAVRVPDDSAFAAAFCLVAAEWWRRNHAGGPWKWDGVFETAGLSADLDRPRIYPVVLRGLRYWKRTLLTVGDSNAYLVTLACEGGLPLNLLRQQGTSLRAYFRALLAEFQICGLRGYDPAELGARVAPHLPVSLRQKVVYQLAGSLVKEIWELQANLGETHTPVKDLDRRDPHWRERLPLVLSDDTARTLLNNLIDDASKLARRSGQGVRAGCLLEHTADGWRLRRQVLLPPSLDENGVKDLLGGDEEIPYRFELYRQAPGGDDERLALVTRRSVGEETRFAVEKAAPRLRALVGEQAADPVVVYGGAGRQRFSAREVPGGARLSDLPWVFVDRKGDGAELSLAGEGSVRTRFPVAWVAVAPGVAIDPEEGATVAFSGRLDAVGRDLVEVGGTVSIAADGHRFRIRTAQKEDEAFVYTVDGELLPVDGETPVYRGIPRVVAHSENGGRRVVPRTELEWRNPKGLTKALWFALSDECRGPVELRYMVGGETRFTRSVTVVPGQARMELVGDEDGRSGEVRLSGFGTSDVGMEPVAGIVGEIRDLPGEDETVALRVMAEGMPPATLAVRVRWSLGREARFHVPFPARGVRFLGRDGQVLPDGELVQVGRLGGVKIRALSSRPGEFFVAEAVLRADDLVGDQAQQLWASERLVVPDRHERDSVISRHELDLRVLQDACRALLSMTRDLDASVHIRVYDDTRRDQSRHLMVRAYDVALVPEREEGQLTLPDYDRHRVGDENGDGREIRLETFPMGDPGSESELLPVVGPFLWEFASERRAPGPWLITGSHDGWGRVRPLCWTVPNGDGGDGLDTKGNGASPLQRAVTRPTGKERTQALGAVLALLAEEPGHEDWEVVEAYLDRLVDLPPGTFDVTSALAETPPATAVALLRAGPDRFGAVWDTLERLPFSWLMVPVAEWVRGARRRLGAVREELKTVAEILGPEIDLDKLARDGFRLFLDEVPMRAPGMKTTAQLVAHRVLGRELGGQQELAMACIPQGRATLCGPVLEGARQELLVTHAEDEWPGGGGIDGWFRHRQDLPEEILGLYLEPPPRVGYRAPVLNVPIAAAVSAAFGAPLPKGAVFHVRRIREFDPKWFDTAYGCALASGIGWLLEHETGALDG